ncbi:MAG: hypothetical protein GY765_07695 [bacterium]|nr:hypothetical protein [bacterium]
MIHTHRNVVTYPLMILLFVFVPILSAGKSTVGILVRAQGDVTVESLDKERPLFIGMAINKSDTISTGRGASASIVTVFSETSLHLVGTDRHTFTKSIGKKHQSMVFSIVSKALHAAEDGGIPILRLGDTGSVDALSLEITPGGTAIISNRPRFTWQKVKGADTFILKMMDQAGEILWQKKTAGVFMEYPKKTLPLLQGKRYFIQIDVQAAGRVLVSKITHVHVLSEKKAGEVRKAREDYKSEPLVLASIYTYYNLNDLAISQLEPMVKTDPGNKYLATMLKRLYVKKKYLQGNE